jgi:hypothetical protein
MLKRQLQIAVQQHHLGGHSSKEYFTKFDRSAGLIKIRSAFSR